MGYVVYNKHTGRGERYYKNESSAKAQVTRHNKEKDWNDRPLPEWAHCSYADYEGIIMRMNDSTWCMWKFFQHGKFANN
jgi:hypothetical protein